MKKCKLYICQLTLKIQCQGADLRKKFPFICSSHRQWWDRGWKLNNWIMIIRYSLLFSPNYSWFILIFPWYSLFIFQFLYQFSFSNSLSVNYKTQYSQMFIAHDIVMTLQPLYEEIDTNARIYTLLIICECCSSSPGWIFLFFWRF